LRILQPGDNASSSAAARNAATAPSFAPSSSAPAASSAIDEDEEAMLYGDSTPAASLFSGAGAAATAATPASESASDDRNGPFWKKHTKAVKPTYWAVLYRENGSLEIHSLPNFTLKYVVLNFHIGEEDLTFFCFFRFL
jgi:hypothetical protein